VCGQVGEILGFHSIQLLLWEPLEDEQTPTQRIQLVQGDCIGPSRKHHAKRQSQAPEMIVQTGTRTVSKEAPASSAIRRHRASESCYKLLAVCFLQLMACLDATLCASGPECPQALTVASLRATCNINGGEVMNDRSRRVNFMANEDNALVRFG